MNVRTVWRQSAREEILPLLPRRGFKDMRTAVARSDFVCSKNWTSNSMTSSGLLICSSCKTAFSESIVTQTVDKLNTLANLTRLARDSPSYVNTRRRAFPSLSLAVQQLTPSSYFRKRSCSRSWSYGQSGSQVSSTPFVLSSSRRSQI